MSETQKTRGILVAVALTGVSLALLPMARAQAPPQWGDLRPGPHAVGFRVIHTVDYARAYRPNGDGGRPMQILLWYPAQVAAPTARLPFGEYVPLGGTAQGARLLTDEQLRQALSFLTGDPLTPYFQGPVPDSAVSRILATPTAAVRGAEPAPGEFPIVLTLGLAPALEQSVRWEYLASHGYVVAALAWIGTSPAWFQRGEWTLPAIQTMGEDLGFVYAHARELPGADTRRVAWVGAMTPAAILLQMRTGRLAGIASVDGVYPPDLDRLPGYDLSRLHIPVLDVRSADVTPDTTLLAAMRWSPRRYLKLERVSHADTYQFRRLARPGTGPDNGGYELITVAVRRFLDAVLKGDSAGFAAVDSLAAPGVLVRSALGRPRVPTEGEFLTVLREEGIAGAQRIYDDVKAREPDYRLFSVEAMRTAAMFLVRDRGVPDALGAFRLLLDAYPRSVAAHLAFGEWSERGNAREAALQAYERAFSLLPEDSSLSGAERATAAADLRSRLARLRGPTP